MAGGSEHLRGPPEPRMQRYRRVRVRSKEASAAARQRCRSRLMAFSRGCLHRSGGSQLAVNAMRLCSRVTEDARWRSIVGVTMSSITITVHVTDPTEPDALSFCFSMRVDVNIRYREVTPS